MNDSHCYTVMSRYCYSLCRLSSQSLWYGMNRGCQQYCGHCSELSLLLCAIPFKVHDPSIWLSPGASTLRAVQCGDPAAKPPHLQSEEPGSEGSSQEGAGPEAQPYLLTQLHCILITGETVVQQKRRQEELSPAISTFFLFQKRSVSSSDPSVLPQ